MWQRLKKVLLADDDKKICDIVEKYIKHAGYETAVAHNGAQTKFLLQKYRFSLVIFDVLLPDTTGFELLEDLRNGDYVLSSASTDKETPVIMLTALGQTQNVLKGLRSGADDYMTKPFEPSELVERIKVILKRAKTETDEITAGNIIINLPAQTVMCEEKSFALQRREFDLLQYLCKNLNKSCTREELLNTVWGWDYDGSDRAVDICVQRLRTKLGEVGANIQIKTVWGAGYRLEPGK
jgi:DNA-binding response OmpR family regulator